MDIEKTKAWLEEKLRVRPRKRKPASPYGRFPERIMASAIDMTLLFSLLNRPFQNLSAHLYSQLDPAVTAQFSQAATVGEFFDFALRSGFLTLWMINFWIQIAVIGALLVLCQAMLKTTPGKWLMGLKITMRDGVTFPPTWRLVLRYFGYILACAPLMLGIVWMMFDKQSRGWQDYLAGTRVMTTRPEGWYWGKVKQGYRWLRDRLRSGDAA
jgi:uncharacterized RDD family membrane protein YckC